MALELQYRAFGGRMIIKVPGDTVKDIIRALGPIVEVFDADTHCGKCKSQNIYPRCRKAGESGEYEYFEIVCGDCEARLSLGQHKKGGTLFADRKNDDGTLKENRGWGNYLGLPAPNENASPRPPAQAEPVSHQAPRTRPGSSAPVVDVMRSDLRFTTLLDRCVGEMETSQVLGEICSALEGRSSAKYVDNVWSEAIARYGDPQMEPRVTAHVLAWMLTSLEAMEKIKK